MAPHTGTQLAVMVPCPIRQQSVDHERQGPPVGGLLWLASTFSVAISASMGSMGDWNTNWQIYTVGILTF